MLSVEALGCNSSYARLWIKIILKMQLKTHCQLTSYYCVGVGQCTLWLFVLYFVAARTLSEPCPKFHALKSLKCVSCGWVFVAMSSRIKNWWPNILPCMWDKRNKLRDDVQQEKVENIWISKTHSSHFNWVLHCLIYFSQFLLLFTVPFLSLPFSVLPYRFYQAVRAMVGLYNI